MAIDFKKLASDIHDAKRIGREAADKVSDGGTANMDYVVINDFRHIKIGTMIKHGIGCSKGRWAGQFDLDHFFGGQGDKNTVGVKAMNEHLKKCGWNTHIKYITD